MINNPNESECDTSKLARVLIYFETLILHFQFIIQIFFVFQFLFVVLMPKINAYVIKNTLFFFSIQTTNNYGT